MREFRWRFDFHNLWWCNWLYLHLVDDSITFLAIHFRRNEEFGVHSVGVTILNFRIGFEKDVPVYADV